MKHRTQKQLLKMLCAVLLSASILMSFGAGCSHSDPPPTQSATSQTADEPAAQTTASALQTTAPAPVDSSEPDAGCDAVFYGDSLTKGNHFDEYFPQLRVVDFGIGGATIEDLTERVPEVAAYHPAKIFVEAGGNNLNSRNEDDCVELFRGLLDALREACPYAEIYVESILPLDARIARQFDCSNRAIRSYNERLKELAAEYSMTYLDIYPLYEDGGELKKEMSRDGIHLFDKSCFAPWAELLRPYLEP